MSISWGKTERFKFSSAGSLVRWSPQTIPALYAVTYKQDPKNKPKAHTVLFFGEAQNLAEQAPACNDEVVETWTKNGNSAEELFIFVHPMPGSVLRDRLTVHQQLVFEYRPGCNVL